MTTDPEARQTALAKIDAKSRRTAPFGYEYRGEWVSPADGVPHPCLCEEVKLDAVEADARDLVAEQILERAKRLAGRDWRHVVPPLQVETAQGDVRAISLAQGSRLADFVNEHNGHPDARARLADWFEQLLGGLAELHAADLTLGPFELPDVLTSGDDAGSPETLRWLHAATLPVEAWSAGTALRRDERTLSAACQNGGMRQRLSAKQQDLRRLGLLTCCLAGGRQAVADADAKGRIKAIGGRRLRWFVRDLLQNEDGESHGSWLSQAGGFVTGLITPRGATSHVDAIGALQDWRKASTSQKPWWTAAFVALILLAALAVWGRRGSRTSNGLQRQLTTTMQQRDDAEAKLGQRTLELEECTRNLVECTRGSERESLADDGVDEERVTHFAASLLRNLLEDESLDREGLLIKAESSLADRETQSEQLQKIREWVGAFEGTTAYHIDVSSLQGKYVDYLLSIRIGDEWQVWENELKANDNYETPPSFEVSWQAGQSIAVLLEENGYTYNENLIEKTFAGPLALWLFHKSLQQLEGSDGKTVLTGEVVDCPGPPREWFKPILSK